MSWNYQSVGENGRLYSYYGKGQEWNYCERGREHTIKVVEACPQSDGMQYYLISNDGKLNDKLISAARLHYILYQKKAQEIKGGVKIPYPLLVEEVKDYFEHNKRCDCPVCGGTGIDYRGAICRCAKQLTYEIKNYSAEKRLENLLKV